MELLSQMNLIWKAFLNFNLQQTWLASLEKNLIQLFICSDARVKKKMIDMGCEYGFDK